MTCVYTGAKVWIANYGATANADIHEIGGAYLFRFGTVTHRATSSGCTHAVRMYGQDYLHPNMEYAVVEADHVKPINNNKSIARK